MRSSAAGDDLAAGDADMRAAGARGDAAAHPSELGVNIERGAGGAQRIVVVRDRRAEQRHHCIADVLVDGAAVTEDDAVD